MSKSDIKDLILVLVGCFITFGCGLVLFYIKDLHSTLKQLVKSSIENRVEVRNLKDQLRVVSVDLHDVTKEMKAVWKCIPGANQRLSDKGVHHG